MAVAQYNIVGSDTGFRALLHVLRLLSYHITNLFLLPCFVVFKHKIIP